MCKSDGVGSVDVVEIRTPGTTEPVASSMAIENERGWFEIEGVVNDNDADQEFVISATKRPNDAQNA